MRTVIVSILFAALAGLVGVAEPTVSHAQPKKAPPGDPQSFIPTAETRQAIIAKTEELRKAIAALKAKKIPDDVLIEVEIYLKAAENIVRLEEWLHANSVRWVQQTLSDGLARAEQAHSGQAPWRNAPGQWVVRAYRADRLDDSIQPYAVLLPKDYGRDPNKKWRVDIVLHGRDASLTEAKFLASHGRTAKAAPADLDYIQLEPYGRGNNAYRWAGERDVFDAMYDFLRSERQRDHIIDTSRIVLRGFSMGGAGTWHIGLHHPLHFAALGPGAGFTTTHGYIARLPKPLPDYQEKCLRIYDAIAYADNAFNVPIVAYSGEKDPQKKAADNIENALKNFAEPVKFTHLVAPGLEHQMPPEWQAKVQTELRQHLAAERKFPERVRFVTYTTRYADFGHGVINALDRHYDKAVVDSRWTTDTLTITTHNIAALTLLSRGQPWPARLTIDGQESAIPAHPTPSLLFLEKQDGKWSIADRDKWLKQLRKRASDNGGLQGPIDDAFMARFLAVPPASAGWNERFDRFTTATLQQFAALWDRYFRGRLPLAEAASINADLIAQNNLILFGDPASNPLIAKILPQLPIRWTKDKLVIDGVAYDGQTHLPVLIYPNPLNPQRYVVINSGHTFKEADLKGTNALLYPRLGDWAVIQPTPTEKDPAGYEVVAAGLFDEKWQFPHK
ncbi:MAG: alpha/beta hydrolase-fold protein [Gemmataceae bacterium]|nr:alpha/beta hydrolase-fold protein [Gemmata sp.]MDW8197701.1 alpha/beta hydrolase-fold protein [Gemmataceae bacterium]